MGSIQIFLGVFVFGVGIALVLETVKKRRKLRPQVPPATDYESANEAMPTQTGKYRVKEALKAVEPTPARKVIPTVSPQECESEKLPDPFQIDVNPQGR
jgi:hypothetical protein